METCGGRDTQSTLKIGRKIEAGGRRQHQARGNDWARGAFPLLLAQTWRPPRKASWSIIPLPDASMALNTPSAPPLSVTACCSSVTSPSKPRWALDAFFFFWYLNKQRTKQQNVRVARGSSTCKGQEISVLKCT